MFASGEAGYIGILKQCQKPLCVAYFYSFFKTKLGIVYKLGMLNAVDTSKRNVEVRCSVVWKHLRFRLSKISFSAYLSRFDNMK